MKKTALIPLLFSSLITSAYSVPTTLYCKYIRTLHIEGPAETTAISGFSAQGRMKESTLGQDKKTIYLKSNCYRCPNDKNPCKDTSDAKTGTVTVNVGLNDTQYVVLKVEAKAKGITRSTYNTIVSGTIDMPGGGIKLVPGQPTQDSNSDFVVSFKQD